MEEQEEFKIGTIRYVIGTTPRNMLRTSDYVDQEWNNIFTRRKLNNATLAWAVYDEHDVRQRTTVVGEEPSRAMKKVMDNELGTDSEEIPRSA